MHCNHLPSPGLCKVFELRIDRANEVELLFASPAFELFFPSDGLRMLSAPEKDRGGAGQVRLPWLKSSEQHGQDKHRRGPSTPRHQALCQAINL